jgi:hypothetical protein
LSMWKIYIAYVTDASGHEQQWETIFK